MTARIPIDPNGYAVNVSTGTVHTRYAGEHAGDVQRTRRTNGVLTLLDGRKPKLCSTCFPSPSYPAPRRSTPQRRRTATPT